MIRGFGQKMLGKVEFGSIRTWKYLDTEEQGALGTENIGNTRVSEMRWFWNKSVGTQGPTDVNILACLGFEKLTSKNN